MSHAANEKAVYKQIAVDIAAKVVSGKYQPGQKIRGRSALASQYNVSPETVRRAVFLLSQVGVLEVRQGSGITILSVEIRDIIIPQGLQEVMSVEAQAEREKNARMLLAEVERDISEMLMDAAQVYEKSEVALRLRTMHLLYESVKGSGGTVVVPSAYSEGFNDSLLDKMYAAAEKKR